MHFERIFFYFLFLLILISAFKCCEIFKFYAVFENWVSSLINNQTIICAKSQWLIFISHKCAVSRRWQRYEMINMVIRLLIRSYLTRWELQRLESCAFRKIKDSFLNWGKLAVNLMLAWMTSHRHNN